MKVSILLFCVGAIAFVPTLLFAQTGASNHPDLNGFWNNQYTPNLAQALGHELPYRPYGLVNPMISAGGKRLVRAMKSSPGPRHAYARALPFRNEFIGTLVAGFSICLPTGTTCSSNIICKRKQGVDQQHCAFRTAT